MEKAITIFGIRRIRAWGVHFPVDQKIKSKHTANAVLKQAGLPKHF